VTSTADPLCLSLSLPIQDVDDLPTSTTCTSTLNIPAYPTAEHTLERLRVAITTGLTGFGRM